MKRSVTLTASFVITLLLMAAAYASIPSAPLEAAAIEFRAAD